MAFILGLGCMISDTRGPSIFSTTGCDAFNFRLTKNSPLPVWDQNRKSKIWRRIISWSTLNIPKVSSKSIHECPRFYSPHLKWTPFFRFHNFFSIANLMIQLKFQNLNFLESIEINFESNQSIEHDFSFWKGHLGISCK